MKWPSALLVFSLGSMVMPFAAQSDEVYVRGAGTSSCGEYLAARAKRSDAVDAQFWQWTHGYLSGYNMEKKDTDPAIPMIPDGPTVLAYLDKHCAQNPLSTPLVGTSNLVRELTDRPKRYPTN
ncbi:MAG: hypothetical protein J0I68_30795 [Achromobacter sp.]|uniref:hypothetical protein n=1 Tax=Achromobacter sp. TaxID=134375 RepID=UPI001AD2E832|nr:hypothetical protein [Achromobacter sp.]MBN9642953.1 hypothetical protein [Achromobacter sp.]